VRRRPLTSPACVAPSGISPVVLPSDRPSRNPPSAPLCSTVVTGFFATMGALTPAWKRLMPIALQTGLHGLRRGTFQPFRLHHRSCLPSRLCSSIGARDRPRPMPRRLGFAICRSSPTARGRIEFVSYGLVVHFPLLSTPLAATQLCSVSGLVSWARRGLAPL